MIEYRIAGIFQGVTFSWMFGFVVIRGKKNCGRVRSKPHPSCMRRAMASGFEVKAVVRGYHQYNVVWDAKVGYNAMLSSSLPIIAFCSIVYFPYWPSFCCCLNQ